MPNQNAGAKSLAMIDQRVQKLRGPNQRRRTDKTVHVRRGRRTLYTPELAGIICQRVAEGESLANIAREPAMPSYPTVMEWLKSNDDFAGMYRQARQDQADTLADEILTIADSVKDAGPADSAKVNAARLRVDARKWVAAKLKPKVYGDRVEGALTGTVAVEHTITDEDRAKVLASLMARQAIQSTPNMLEAQRLLTDRKEGITDIPDR